MQALEQSTPVSASSPAGLDLAVVPYSFGASNKQVRALVPALPEQPACHARTAQVWQTRSGAALQPCPSSSDEDSNEQALLFHELAAMGGSAGVKQGLAGNKATAAEGLKAGLCRARW